MKPEDSLKAIQGILGHDMPVVGTEPSDTVTLRLTPRQYEKLLDVLIESQDEGPKGEGWKSDELTALVDFIEAAKGEQEP